MKTHALRSTQCNSTIFGCLKPYPTNSGLVLPIFGCFQPYLASVWLIFMIFGCFKWCLDVFLSHILSMLVLPIFGSFKPHLFVSRHIQSHVIVSNGRWRFFSAAFSKGQVTQRPFLESFLKWKKKSYVPSGLKVDCPNFFACILNVNLGKLKPWCRILFLVHPFVKFMLDMKWRKIL